jgi:hypothetical protein
VQAFSVVITNHNRPPSWFAAALVRHEAPMRQP